MLMWQLLQSLLSSFFTCSVVYQSLEKLRLHSYFLQWCELILAIKYFVKLNDIIYTLNASIFFLPQQRYCICHSGFIDIIQWKVASSVIFATLICVCVDLRSKCRSDDGQINGLLFYSVNCGKLDANKCSYTEVSIQLALYLQSTDLDIFTRNAEVVRREYVLAYLSKTSLFWL